MHYDVIRPVFFHIKGSLFWLFTDKELGLICICVCATCVFKKFRFLDELVEFSNCSFALLFDGLVACLFRSLIVG